MAVLPSATANLNLPVITRPAGACGEPSALMSAVPAEASRIPPVSLFFFHFFSPPLPSEADFNPPLGLRPPTAAAAFGSASPFSFFSFSCFLNYDAVCLVHRAVPSIFIRSFCGVTFLHGSTKAASSVPPHKASSEVLSHFTDFCFLFFSRFSLIQITDSNLLPLAC